jgi:hypothetical protein
MASAHAVRVIGALCVIAVACGDDADVGSSTATDGMTTVGTTLTTTTLSTSSDPDTSTSGDPDTSTSGADTTTGGPTCPETHTCIAVPDEWTGPVLLRESEDPKAKVECPKTYPDDAVAGGADLEADAAECGCSCGDAAGSTCALSTTLHHWGTDPTCSVGTPAESFNVFTTICNPLGEVIPSDSYFQVEPVLVEGGACAPEATLDVPPPIFGRTGTTCGGAEMLEGCEDSEVCAPRAEDESLCIWREGDEDCPEGFEGRRELYHQSLDDQRGCNECTCGEPVGLCDNASITMFVNVCNPPVSGNIVASGECYPGSTLQGTQSVIFDVGDPNAFCVAGAAVPTGEATPIEPITVCCAE